jgi:hypothetical protein
MSTEQAQSVLQADSGLKFPAMNARKILHAIMLWDIFQNTIYFEACFVSKL